MKTLTIEQQAKSRTRRLRKKLRVGEFQELGFSISFRFDSQRYTLDQALDHWIEFVESQGGALAAVAGKGQISYPVIWRASSGVPSARSTGSAPASGSIVSPALPVSSASN